MKGSKKYAQQIYKSWKKIYDRGMNPSLRGIIMPSFLDEFASSINGKKEAMKEKIFKGKPNPLQHCFKKHFDSHWVSIEETAEFVLNPSKLDVTAIDSSVYTNLLSTGGIFYIIRSLAVCRDKEWKRLETDIFFTKEGFIEASDFIGRKMELLEFKVAIDALRNGFKCNAILLDGSLYGRAMHLPVETKIEEEQALLLHYFQIYQELLDLCRRENILLIGVSKESRSTFFRDYLLSLIFDEELKKIEIDGEELRKLKAIFPEVLDNERAAFDKFEKLKVKHGAKLETIELILNELASSRPDYQLVINFAETLGYTQPLLLGPSARAARAMKQYSSNPREYVKTNFPKTVREKGDEFINWAAEIISNISKLPSFISFHILLDQRDSPIRIDLPYWEQTLSEITWPKVINLDLDLEALLRIMITGYCGLDRYNLWLADVDEKVRLRRKIVDEIYFPYLEKLFQSKIIRGRGYRRVKYP
jgi:hypothetical protein